MFSELILDVISSSRSDIGSLVFMKNGTESVCTKLLVLCLNRIHWFSLHPTHFLHTLWLLTISGLICNWHPRKVHTITHSWKNKTCQTVAHPGTNVPHYCLTSISSVTCILPLSYWARINKGTYEQKYSNILYIYW